MSTPPRPTPALAVYNPGLLSKEDLIAGFVARQALLARLLDDLRREVSRTGPQHHLVIGQRGQGKTTLLRRLAYAVHDDAELSGAWFPLVFPEEQYNISDLGDFWVNCVDALGDCLEQAGQAEASENLDRRVSVLPRQRERRSPAALELLVSEADRIKRRLLLLVDNIDVVFDRLDEQQEWEFRRIISEESRLLIVGAATRSPSAVHEYSRAFYDFFQVEGMNGLNEEETFAVLRQLARQSGRDDLMRVMEEQRGRIRGLRHLSGGNPRTLVLLFRVLSANPEEDMQRDVEQLLDLYTPLYKARLEELAVQALKVVDAMAIHWDPTTAGELAEMVLLPVNQVSAQLIRLEDEGMVEKAPWPGESKTGFQIAERFFNIWYLMRASRRVRRKLIWLVRFLEGWFSGEELETRSRHLLEKSPERIGAERYAAEALAYAQAVHDKRLRLDLEDAALRAVEPDRVRELIDLSDVPQQALERHERRRVLERLKERTLALRAAWGEVDPAEFWRLLAGSPHYSLAEKQRIVGGLEGLGGGELAELAAKLTGDEQALLSLAKWGPNEVKTLYDLLGRGRIADVYDWETIRDSVSTDVENQIRVAIQSRVWPGTPHVLTPLESDRAESALRTMMGDASLASLAWCLLGELYVQLARFEDAARFYREAIRLADLANQPYIDAMIDLGWVLNAKLQRWSEAEAVCRRATELAPGDPAGWLRLGIVLGSAARSEEAEQACRRSLDLDPKYAGALVFLGSLLEKQPSRYDEAMETYRKAIEADQQYAYAWTSLGRLLATKLSRRDDAERAFRKAVEIDPRDGFAWTNLGDLLADQPPRHGEAEQAYRKAVEAEPTDPYAWTMLGGFLQWQLSRPEEAEAAYRKAIEADPKHSWAWFQLGGVMEHFGRIVEAGQAYLEELRLAPGEPAVSLARVCERLAESDEGLAVAEELAVEARKLRPTDNHVAFVLAGIFVLEGKLWEGGQILRSLALDESIAAPPSLLLFRAFVKSGRIDDGLTLMQETGTDERWRPVYEALRAAKAGSADHLKRIAPEVQTIAEEILRSIAPDLPKAPGAGERRSAKNKGRGRRVR